jgi:hypothetical protein
MMPATSTSPASRPNRSQVRSLPIAEWPAADRTHGSRRVVRAKGWFGAVPGLT